MMDFRLRTSGSGLRTTDFGRWVPVAAVVLAISTVEARQATGSLSGCARDSTGERLPGVRVRATRDGKALQTITDGGGCYDFDALPAGPYAVYACLPGFTTVARELVIEDRRDAFSDFQLPITPICDCIAPRDLAGLWKLSDVVVRVSLGNQRLAPNADAGVTVIHSARLLHVWKQDKRVGGDFVEFRQRLEWNRRLNAFERVPGGVATFTIEDGRLSGAGLSGYNGKTVDVFELELYALAAK